MLRPTAAWRSGARLARREAVSAPRRCAWAASRALRLKTVTPTEAAAQRDHSARPTRWLVDVREPQEVQRQGVVGADVVNVPQSAFLDEMELAAEAEEAPDYRNVLPDFLHAKDARMTVFCARGVRSAAVAQQLEQAGWREVQHMSGGLSKWLEEDPRLELREDAAPNTLWR